VKIHLSIFFLLASFAVSAQQKNIFSFTENKGQVSDQLNNQRNDILFGGASGHLAFHLRANGISYQQCRIDSWINAEDIKSGRKYNLADKATIYRVDVSWLNCNAALIEKGEALPGSENYYSDVCPNGVTGVQSFKSVTYKNIYSGIDLKWYSKNGKLKYDFILAAGADHRQIQMEFKGAKKLYINTKGELIVQTPLGFISKQAPLVYQSNKTLKAKWMVNGNIASFSISNIDPSLPLVIDPGVRQWGTYYGGNQTEVSEGCTVDPSGNLYMVGYTTSAGGTVIATAGAHQTTYSGSGLENAMLAKFTPAGVRIWATYYGGNVREIGTACSADNAGNIFMSGNSVSNNGTVIATVGSHQPVAGGNWDAFLVKFNSAGVRQWGTYYGGSGGDFGMACAAASDGSGDIYLGGRTDWSGGTVIATPGSHQSSYVNNVDAFLVKFNSAGVRQWGTYYGGDGTEAVNGCMTDASGNIYITGQTSSTFNIASPGAYQTSYVAGNDAFLVKFNNSGIRQWGSYYGGLLDDYGYGIAKDASGNIFVAGKSNSTDGNSIATDGSYQNTFGGGNFDAFVVKFNSAATLRSWGTYYGGAGDDEGQGCTVNVLGYVYIVGITSTSVGTSIASPGSHQPNYGGDPYDAFLSQLDVNGNRVWGTYYGGITYDGGNGCTVDNSSNVYFSGLTDCAAGTAIATVGSHQPAYGGGSCDAFFVKFFDCSSPPAPNNITTPANESICTGNSVTLAVSGIGSLSWFSVPSGGSPIGTGSVYVTPVLSSGTYTYYAEANTCTNSAGRSPVTVTVHALPNISTSSSNTILCSGQTATLYSSGIVTYSWSTGSSSFSTAVSPTISATYTVAGTDVYGCSNSATITQPVAICTSLADVKSSPDEINVYPNPTSSAIFADKIPEGSMLRLYNAAGELILSQAVNAEKAVIDLSGKAKGIYFLRISSDGKEKTVSIIRE
jgi:hypothetical protein